MKLSSDTKQPKLQFKLAASGPVCTTTASSSGTVILFHLSLVTGAPVTALETIEYELGMFLGIMALMKTAREKFEELVVRNALTEAAVLHARSVCAVFLDDDPRDLTVSQLFDDWEFQPRYAKIKDAIGRLKAAFGIAKDPASHRSVLNRMVMHATKYRGAYGMYDTVLTDLYPIICEIGAQIESLKGIQFKAIT
jgi:hypothetical protein